MNIALIGYGKMGHEIERCAVERGHCISQTFSSHNPASPELLATCDCCVDFSSASCLEPNLSHAFSSGIPIIVGTTGWKDRMQYFQEKTERENGSVVYASNFSLGANILFRLTEISALIFNQYSQYDVSIHETHHIMKKDSPSGTAMVLAQKILDRIDRKEKITFENASKTDLLVSSSRTGTVVGDHSVRFSSSADDIIISHSAHNRSGFALGAVLAAEWIGKRKGFFSFEELLWEHSPAGLGT